MKKKVLISAAGGSAFPYLFKFLENYDLFLTDANEVIKYLYPKRKTFIVPFATDDSFEIVMEDIIKKNDIEYYIPYVDKEILKAFNIVSKFENLKLICPNKKFVDLCLNKYELIKELERNSISKLETILGSDFNFEMDFPLFIKPITSRGSRGICKINNVEQFNAYFALENYKIDKIIVQEYLDGTEYTVSVVVNNLNSLIAVVPKKIFIKKGITISGVTEKNNKILEKCREIVSKLKPCGPFNVQLKIVDDEVKIFEINPRFSTTSILTCQAGINEFGLCIESYNKKDIKYIESFKENLYLFRKWENIFYER